MLPGAHPVLQVYLVPGDTFRAAAAEQLTEWADRAGAVMGEFKENAKPQKVMQVRGMQCTPM